MCDFRPLTENEFKKSIVMVHMLRAQGYRLKAILGDVLGCKSMLECAGYLERLLATAKDETQQCPSCGLIGNPGCKTVGCPDNPLEPSFREYWPLSVRYDQEGIPSSEQEARN